MILREFFTLHHILMTEKGKSAFNKAITQYYPNLDKLYNNGYYWDTFSRLDLPEKDCIALLQLTSKYVKYWIYS